MTVEIELEAARRLLRQRRIAHAVLGDGGARRLADAVARADRLPTWAEGLRAGREAEDVVLEETRRSLTVEQIAEVFDVPLEHAMTEAEARAAIDRAWNRASAPPWLAETFDFPREHLEEHLGRDVAAARPVTFATPRPQWENVAKAVREIARIMGDQPDAVALTDRTAAYVRDTLDALGLSVRDEGTLYVVITAAGLMVEMSHNALTKGKVTPDVVLAIAQIAQSLTAALIPYMPPEARS